MSNNIVVTVGNGGETSVAGIPSTDIEIGQTLAEVQQPRTFIERTESPTANNILVTGGLGASVLVLAGINYLFRNKEH